MTIALHGNAVATTHLRLTTDYSSKGGSGVHALDASAWSDLHRSSTPEQVFDGPQRRRSPYPSPVLGIRNRQSKEGGHA